MGPPRGLTAHSSSRACTVARPSFDRVRHSAKRVRGSREEHGQVDGRVEMRWHELVHLLFVSQKPFLFLSKDVYTPAAKQAPLFSRSDKFRACEGRLGVRA